jgi:hypothetical protein
MTLAYILFAVALFCIFILRVQKKVKAQQQGILNSLKAEGITFDLVTQSNLSTMGIDERNQLLVIMMNGVKSVNILNTQTGTLKIRFSEICDVVILKDEEVFNETSISRGVFSGSIKQKHVHDVDGVSLKIITNNITNPEVIYPFKGIVPVAKAVEEAEKWYRAIRIIIERNGVTGSLQLNNVTNNKLPDASLKKSISLKKNTMAFSSTQPVNNTDSVSDELLKLHDLREKNIITQEEFEQMKKRVLS